MHYLRVIVETFTLVKQICRYLYLEHLWVTTLSVIVEQNYGMSSAEKLHWQAGGVARVKKVGA